MPELTGLMPWAWTLPRLARGQAVLAYPVDEPDTALPITGRISLRHTMTKHAERGLVLRSGDEELTIAGTLTVEPAPIEPVESTPPEVVADKPAHPGMRLLKAAPSEQKVVGVVFEPDIVDTQGDITAAVEIEAACHQFLADYRAGKTELYLGHELPLTDDDAVLVENYILPVACEIGGQPVRRGAWLQVWHIKSAALWQRVLDGTLTGFSFGGTGVRLPARKADGPAIRFERDADGLAKRIVTPAGCFDVIRDEMHRAIGMDRVA